ncbi:MAG: hypothetical protein HY270_23490 [Deltaproteobacteria bacterium]|nr:hypothetical protein [Deltaproteobacteria bacterium]
MKNSAARSKAVGLGLAVLGAAAPLRLRLLIRSRIFSVVLAIGLAASISCGEEAGRGSMASGSRWVPDGQWVRDRQGRLLLLRGINYSGLEWGNFLAPIADSATKLKEEES